VKSDCASDRSGIGGGGDSDDMLATLDRQLVIADCEKQVIARLFKGDVNLLDTVISPLQSPNLTNNCDTFVMGAFHRSSSKRNRVPSSTRSTVFRMNCRLNIVLKLSNNVSRKKWMLKFNE
jgi:hypothetical protein